MTVKEMIEKLKEYPEDYKVYFYIYGNSQFSKIFDQIEIFKNDEKRKIEINGEIDLI